MIRYFASLEFWQQILVGVASGVIAAGLLRVGWLTFRAVANLIGQFRNEPILLFVSTGGTCRDPMAKAIADRLLEGRRPAIRIYAVGIASGHSKDAAPAARLVVKEALGFDFLRNHRARAIDSRLAERAKLILTMSDDDTRKVRKLFPAVSGKTHTLTRFVGHPGNIENPYRNSGELDERALERYRAAFSAINSVLSANADKIYSAMTA